MTVPAPPTEAGTDSFHDFDSLARWIMVVAAAEARLARHPMISSAHVVLATWLAQGTPLADALRSGGFSGRIAKAWLEHEVRPDQRSDEPRPDDALMAGARRIAKRDPDGTVRAAHLFMAATEESDAAGVRMIRAQGIGLSRIKAMATTAGALSSQASVWERLDDTAQAVIVKAGECAADLGHAEIGVGHLILGLVNVASGAQVLLHEARVTPEAARIALVATATGRLGADEPEHRPFSSEALAVVRDTGIATPGQVTAMDLFGVIIALDRGEHFEMFQTLGTDVQRLRDTMTPPAPQPPAQAPSGAPSATRRPNLAVIGGPPDGAPNIGFRRAAARQSGSQRSGRVVLGVGLRTAALSVWRQAVVLAALGFVGVVTGDVATPWLRLAFGLGAAAALAVGATALTHHRRRKNGYRAWHTAILVGLAVTAAGALIRAAAG